MTSIKQSDAVVHMCNPSMPMRRWKVEAGESSGRSWAIKSSQHVSTARVTRPQSGEGREPIAGSCPLLSGQVLWICIPVPPYTHTMSE